MRRYLPKNAQELIHWYERYISPLSLVAGFLADNFFLLRRVDLLRSNLLLFSYLIIAALGIFAINAIEQGKLRGKVPIRIAPFIPVVVQFCFGGLFSGYLSLYSRSASVAVSWIFVIALAGLLLGNERFTRLYVKFAFQVSVYFLVLFSFLQFFLPVILHRIGPIVFIGSGILSLALIALVIYILFRIAPDLYRASRFHVLYSIAAIFIVFNALYFTNAIPPLPLALKSAGVYHAVIRESDGTYRILGEPLHWYEEYLNYAPTFHRAFGQPIYVWSAVFAPSGLSTEVLHQWQRYDPTTGAWITTNTVSFSINGGRDGGYRGYSEKDNALPGKWRVNVITQYGQLIGRIKFDVVDASSTPELIQIQS